VAQGRRILFEAEGTIEGQITAEPRGTNGFGYDPIFFYPPFNCTLAELEAAQKSAVSHRGRAFGALRAFLIREKEKEIRQKG
jgi:XTP/dITP diphosphohydrolase